VPYTDVGWSPYFPLIAGLVTEIGGLVSHGTDISAIVRRNMWSLFYRTLDMLVASVIERLSLVLASREPQDRCDFHTSVNRIK